MRGFALERESKPGTQPAENTNMPRRARRPHFGSDDVKRLLVELHRARSDAIMCGAAAGFGSPRHMLVETLQKAIDALGQELTGDPRFFSAAGSTGPVTGISKLLSELADQLAGRTPGLPPHAPGGS
jgi:hypothetical protein